MCVPNAVLSVVVLGQLSLAAGAESSRGPQEVEAALRHAYADKGLVQKQTVDLVNFGTINYLEAGHKGSRAVIFCHGAVYNSDTWKVIGVLDLLSEHGFRAIAPDLPRRGRKRDRFVKAFASALGLLIDGARVMIVAASMGGSYALPFVQQEPASVAGYISVAGSTSGLKRGQHAMKTPTMAVFGDQDPRYAADRDVYSTSFSSLQLYVFPNAPHACYLRDENAAKEFSDLVLRFAGGKQLADETQGLTTTVNLEAQWIGTANEQLRIETNAAPPKTEAAQASKSLSGGLGEQGATAPLKTQASKSLQEPETEKSESEQVQPWMAAAPLVFVVLAALAVCASTVLCKKLTAADVQTAQTSPKVFGRTSSKPAE